MNRQNSLPAKLSVVGCILLYSAVSGIGANCRGVFFMPVSGDLGVSLSRLTVFYVFYGITSAVATPLCCRLFRRFHISPVLAAMSLIYGAAAFFMGSVSRVESFYALAAIQGIVGGFLIFYPVQTIISQWFPRKKGAILGIVLMSSGVCGAVMNPVISGWISSFGWRHSFRLTGGIILGLTLFASLICFHWDPPREPVPVRSRESGKKSRLSLAGSDLVKVILMYVISLCLALAMSSSQHLPSLAVDFGHTSAFGAKLVSAAMVGNLLSKLALGSLNDRIGPQKSAFTGIIFVLVGCGLLLFSGSELPLLIGAFLIGIILALSSMHISLVSRVLLGSMHERVYPAVCAVVSFVGSVSSMILSLIRDYAGGYRSVMIYLSAIMLVCAACVLYAASPRLSCNDSAS